MKGEEQEMGKKNFKYAEDFRRIARESLRGQWKKCALAFLAAFFLGGTASVRQSISISEKESEAFAELTYSDFWVKYGSLMTLVILLIALWMIFAFFFGGGVKLGYASFNLKLIRKQNPAFREMFSLKSRWIVGVRMKLLTSFYMLMWTLLLFVPGIIKGYSYAMTPYIMAEKPDMGVNQAITESRRLMNGNKWRLFCLDFSFFGWTLLASLPIIILRVVLSVYAPLGNYILEAMRLIPFSIPSYIAMCFVYAYIEAANAAFYEELIQKK